MIGFIDTWFTRSTRDYRQYSAITDLHTSQFAVTHPLGFSVLTSRILATDLSESHCHFKSHMGSSFRSLISFFPLFCNCQLNSIPLLPSSYTGRLASRNSTLHSFLNICCWTLFDNAFARTTQKTASIFKEACWLSRCLARDVLLLRSYACAGMCLPSRCLAMGIHVTIYRGLKINSYRRAVRMSELGIRNNPNFRRSLQNNKGCVMRWRYLPVTYWRHLYFGQNCCEIRCGKPSLSFVLIFRLSAITLVKAISWVDHVPVYLSIRTSVA
jgi:hypothetical protein